MNGIAVLISLAAVGVDYGWQPAADGQLEYIIQIEPSLLENLKNGDEIVSEILPEARGVRKFRIRVGNGPLPRIGRGPESAGRGRHGHYATRRQPGRRTGVSAQRTVEPATTTPAAGRWAQ